MIVTLEGIVSEKQADVVVLNVRGVGYGLFMPHSVQGSLQSGQTSKVYVYEHIREAGYDLFGFLNRADKAFFELLLSVNGVGPKMALNVMNIGTSQQVRAAIASGEVKTIQQANGVGKRVAERLVVELKDKVGLEGVDLSEAGLLQGEQSLQQDEAVQALVALGYTAQDAAQALAKIDSSLDTEERIKQALKAV